MSNPSNETSRRIAELQAHSVNAWDTLRTSYWFVPSVFAAVALMLSFLMPRLDVILAESQWRLPDELQTTTEAARATVSALAGAMMAVTGTVFSITVVTLSLTSQQFGPRLLRRFMYDLPTQVTLGVFLSTGFYCLLIMRVVENNENGFVAPHVSVLTAVVWAVLSMVMLIVFIHHIAILIQAPHIVASVAADLDSAIDRLFPERIGEAGDEEAPTLDEPNGHEQLLGVCSSTEGYVQSVNGEALLWLASQHQVVIRLLCRPGDFVAEDSPLASVYSREKQEAKDLAADEFTTKFNEAIIVGIRRTPRQDVECAIEELVEVAVRALSPGINDPFTAINCIDRLGACLRRLSQRKMPSPYRYDDKQQLCVIARPVSFAEVLDSTFNQIRQHSRSVAVTLRLLEAIASVVETARRPTDHADSSSMPK